MPRCAQVAAARSMTDARLTRKSTATAEAAIIQVRVQSTPSPESLQHKQFWTRPSLPCVLSGHLAVPARVWRVRAACVAVHGCTMGAYVSWRRLCSTSQAQDRTIEGLTTAAIQSARKVGELECELAKSIATIDELHRAAAASTARFADLSREVEELRAQRGILKATVRGLREAGKKELHAAPANVHYYR